MGCATHVLLHQPHIRAGFDVEPAGIKGNAFANDGNTWMLGVAPDKFDETRCPMLFCRLTDGVDHRIADFKLMALGDVHCGFKLCPQHLRCGLKASRS